MKIENTDRDRASRADKKKRTASAQKAAPAARPRSSFNEHLMRSSADKIREELALLLTEIDNQALEIEKSLTFETLRVYKELIRKFVGKVVNDLYKVDKKYSVSPTGKKKTHILIKKIDEELERLSDEFLQRQGNLLGFLGRLDQIRGMLLDLYS